MIQGVLLVQDASSLSSFALQGRCNRDKCKYFHPPQHLKEQLLINGRNHLAFKNAFLQQCGLVGPPLMPGGQLASPAAVVSTVSIPNMMSTLLQPTLAPGFKWQLCCSVTDFFDNCLCIAVCFALL